MHTTLVREVQAAWFAVPRHPPLDARAAVAAGLCSVTASLVGGAKPWHALQHGWALKTQRRTKEPSRKRPRVHDVTPVGVQSKHSLRDQGGWWLPGLGAGGPGARGQRPGAKVSGSRAGGWLHFGLMTTI